VKPNLPPPDSSEVPVESTSETTKVQQSLPRDVPVKNNDETEPQVKPNLPPPDSSEVPIESTKIVSLPISSPPLRLRSVGKILSSAAVQDMLANRGFYDQTRNRNGKGITHDYRRKTLANRQAIVEDQTTRLVWQQSGSSNRMKYKDAKNYIRQLNGQRFAGFSNWRLPTLEEALSLMEPEEKNGVLYIDPVFSQVQIKIWTDDEESVGTAWVASFKWMTSFKDGRCYRVPFDDLYYVRAVR